MKSKRPVVLMTILIALVCAYVYRTDAYVANFLGLKGPGTVAGADSVSGLKLVQRPDGQWMASFDYFFTGPPGTGMVKVEQFSSKEGAGQPLVKTSARVEVALIGQNHLELPLQRPTDEPLRITREIGVVLINQANKASTSQQLHKDIEWPSFAVMRLDEIIARHAPADVVKAQALQIDTGDAQRTQDAKDVLERLLLKFPQTDTAYIELARIAMKTNWGPQGLAQAEALLGSARQIRPDNPDMKILLGYVYAHQKRFKEAEALFDEVSQAETPNLWLWSNWGELLQMQGKQSAAIEKYKRALAAPPKDDTYDQGRRWAFDRLIGIELDRRDLDATEALYKQREAEYGFSGCNVVPHARFLLFQRFDAQAALELGRKLEERPCAQVDANEVLGLANYMLWAAGNDPARAQSLREARVRFPAGPRLFYQLAATDKTAEVARKLVSNGDKVDQPDNSGLTALAYALQARDIATARRLLRIGARADATIGPDQMPVALLPVLARDLEAIKLMERSGVDYSNLHFRGMTALDHARANQDRELLEILAPRGKSL